MNRRQFLRTNAALATGAIALPTIIPSSALGLDGAVAPSNRITVGLIGAGDRGMHVIKKEFIPNKNAQVVAACDAFKRRIFKSRRCHDLRPERTQRAQDHLPSAFGTRAFVGLLPFGSAGAPLVRDEDSSPNPFCWQQLHLLQR